MAWAYACAGCVLQLLMEDTGGLRVLADMGQYTVVEWNDAAHSTILQPAIPGLCNEWSSLAVATAQTNGRCNIARQPDARGRTASMA